MGLTAARWASMGAAARRAILAFGALTALAAGLPTSAHAAVSCANDPARDAGGEWRGYGHDLSNTRSQPAERQIGPANVASLGPAWTFSSASAGGSGDFTGTPVVADGCVYAGTNAGWVFAINADTGRIVWRAKLPKTGATNGNINSSLAVPGDGRVYASVTNPTQNPCSGPQCEGPYAIAFDQATGKVDWRTPPIDTQVGADVYSSPVVFYPTGSSPDAPGAGAQSSLPRTCTSRRSFTIRLRAPRRQRLVRALVFVDGRRVRTLTGRRLRAPVDLRGLPAGRFTVRVVARTNQGRTVRESRTYRTCTPKVVRPRRRGTRLRHHGAPRAGIAATTAPRAAAARDGVVIIGIAGSAAEIGSSEQIRNANQGSVILLDTATGRTLKRVWTIRRPTSAARRPHARPRSATRSPRADPCGRRRR